MSKMRFWKCEFYQIRNVNFRINWGLLPQCGLKQADFTVSTGSSFISCTLLAIIKTWKDDIAVVEKYSESRF